MRLWHKDMIPVLPRQQLLSQWRECCCIARNIAVNGTPNHILVNKILDYPSVHFVQYSANVMAEMKRRGYKVNPSVYSKLVEDIDKGSSHFDEYNCIVKLFDGWHNDRYLQQCFFNLQEKYDCGGISKEEWEKVVDFTSRKLTGITM